MDMSVFGLEPGTSARILIVGAATTSILALITAVARRDERIPASFGIDLTQFGFIEALFPGEDIAED